MPLKMIQALLGLLCQAMLDTSSRFTEIKALYLLLYAKI